MPVSIPVKALLLLALCLFTQLGRAQLRVENEQGLDFPQERAQTIFATTCRVVAKEFHVSPAEFAKFPLVLELGSQTEAYLDDHDHEIYRLQLAKWDENKFAVGVIRLAIQKMITAERRNRLLAEIIARTDLISPVNVSGEKSQPRRKRHQQTLTPPKN